MIVSEIKRPGEVGFDQTEFNMARWKELLDDEFLGTLSQRIETDRFGHTIMTPPPAPRHGNYQSRIVVLLHQNSDGGRIITECPISTSDGVKACDVVWVSNERFAPMADAPCFNSAPEVCVEILSPSNSKGEIEEKTRLYFEAGAQEVWLCDSEGRMSFLCSDSGTSMTQSGLLPQFPDRVDLS